MVCVFNCSSCLVDDIQCATYSWFNTNTYTNTLTNCCRAPSQLVSECCHCFWLSLSYVAVLTGFFLSRAYEFAQDDVATAAAAALAVRSAVQMLWLSNNSFILLYIHV